MEGGIGPASAPAPPISVAASRKKSLVELWIGPVIVIWIGPWIVIWIELKIACMQRPSKSLDYHHRGASPSIGHPLLRRRSAAKISAFGTRFRQLPRKFLRYIAI